MEEFGLGLLNERMHGEWMGCGFRTLNQLYSWFSESELRRLRLLGYAVVPVVVDRILAESERQLVFARSAPQKRGVILGEFS
jgi:hypothetical protein